MRQALLLTLTFFLLQNSTRAQNVGIGTNDPQAKLHVAGDLLIDSSFEANKLVLKDSTGDIRFIFDADRGAFEMMADDTVWFSRTTNSPSRDTFWLKGKESFLIINNNLIHYPYRYREYWKKKTPGPGYYRYRLICEYYGQNDPLITQPLLSDNHYNQDGCVTYKREIFEDSSDSKAKCIQETWYDCPSGKKTKERVKKKGSNETRFFDDDNQLIPIKIIAEYKDYTWTRDAKTNSQTCARPDSTVTMRWAIDTVFRTVYFPTDDKTVEIVAVRSTGDTIKTTKCPKEGKMTIEMPDGTKKVIQNGVESLCFPPLDAGFKLWIDTTGQTFGQQFKFGQDSTESITNPGAGSRKDTGIKIWTFENDDDEFKFDWTFPLDTPKLFVFPDSFFFNRPGNFADGLTTPKLLWPSPFSNDSAFWAWTPGNNFKLDFGASSPFAIQADPANQSLSLCESKELKMKLDGIIDMIWELDAAQSDGKVRYTDATTGEVIEQVTNPAACTFDLFHLTGSDTTGGLGLAFPMPSNDDKTVFRLFGKEGSGLKIEVNDTIPPIGIARDLTLNIDQDQERLTVSNIGSSGDDGVRIDLAEPSVPRLDLFGGNNGFFRLELIDSIVDALPPLVFNFDQDDQAAALCGTKELQVKLDNIMELLWELDSSIGVKQTVTDPVTGEVMAVTINPNECAQILEKVGEQLAFRETLKDAERQLEQMLMDEAAMRAIKQILDATEGAEILEREQLEWKRQLDEAAEALSEHLEGTTGEWNEKTDLASGTRTTDVGGDLEFLRFLDEFNEAIIALAKDTNSGNQTGFALLPNAGMVDVFGSLQVNGNLSKMSGTFKIDHPLDPRNKYLYHSFVESPDMMNVYNGNITTDANGFATVTLPDYFETLNRDFRYQLTVIGSFARAIVQQEVSDNAFVIQTDAPHIKVSWQVTGIRQDPYAEANRVQVEVAKEPAMQGKLLFDPSKKSLQD